MTTSLRESFSFDASFVPFSESEKVFFRASNRRVVHGAVISKFLEKSEADNLTRALLAERLGVDRAQITRWLSSPGNWTIDTLSDLLLAMGCRARVEAEEIASGDLGNRFLESSSH